MNDRLLRLKKGGIETYKKGCFLSRIAFKVSAIGLLYKHTSDIILTKQALHELNTQSFGSCTKDMTQTF